MRHSLQLIILLTAGLFFLGSCSKKETFFFSGGTGSFSTNSKTPKTKIMSDSIDVLKPEIAPDVSDNDYPVVFTAALRPEIVVLDKPNPKKVVLGNIELAKPPQKSDTQLTNQGEKISRLPNATKEEIVIPAEEVKTNNKMATQGMLLSLGALVTFLLAVGAQLPILLIPGTLAALAGTIMSLVGLGQIRKNPEKYSGKGKGLIGFLVGLLMSAIYLLMLSVLMAL